MKKNKFISLFLAALMVLSCFVAAGMTSSAASGDVIYFDNSTTKFTNVYCYLFNDNGSNAQLPGEAMTNVSGDIWEYNVSGDWDYVIFGDGEIKSAELSYPADNQIAKPDSDGEGFSVSWSDYSVQETTIAETVEKKAKAKTGAGTTIYCQNDAGWPSVYCYMWNGSGGSGNENSGWPGKAMTNIGENVWEYTPDKNYENIIFNNNSGTQTDNLTVESGKNLFNNKTNSWDIYSTSPVKITSFTTDVESPSYTNSTVKLSAAATSSQGAVTYKFSVKSSSGAATVLSDSASSSVVWTPTAAGTYTLTVDVRDSIGNNNSRSIKDFVIKDASNLAEPFISSFSNSLGTLKTIKVNTSITFTTGAIGGKTGTNLLFYKFIITDPSGNENTPYYTLNKSYTYTPNKLGTYTVKAFVQNSYNNTVERTYTYECKGEIPADDKDTQPTQQPYNPATQPVTQGPTEPIVTVPSPSLGDVNRDGSVNIKDATLIQKYVARMATFDDAQLKLADANKDGYVSVKDATQIQKLVAKLISSF